MLVVPPLYANDWLQRLHLTGFFLSSASVIIKCFQIALSFGPGITASLDHHAASFC